MGKPAARMGDSTGPGGVMVGGCPTVLIGGKPSARMTDMPTCRLVTGVVPHVGAPILPRGPVLVRMGRLPAATVGNMCTCVGPPDSIVMGCVTVLIGP